MSYHDAMARRPPGQNSASRAVRLKRELDAARRVSQALSQHIQVDEMVDRALRTALDVVGAESASVLLADPDSRQLVFRNVVGAKAPQLRGMAIPWDQGIASTVFVSGVPHIAGDVSRSRRHLARVDAATGYRTRDMITLPLKQWEGKPIGVLQVLNKKRGRLGKEDLAILTIISALTATAIEQARLFEETKLAEVGRLLGDVGHDIGNLLTPVICGVGLLGPKLDEFFDRLPQSVEEKEETRQLCREVLGLLKSNARRIQDQVKEMADCVKGLSAPLQFSPCQVASVVQQVFDTLRLVAEEKGIAFRSEGLEGLPAILADERRLYVAFYNLVNNAIPEVPPGGSITVLGRLEPRAAAVGLSVVDTGRGMSPEVRESLFTSRAISRKVGGTGLGTKIVKDVVEAHGGRITVESQKGVGTRFHLRLPIHPSGWRRSPAGSRRLPPGLRRPSGSRNVHSPGKQKPAGL